MKTSRKRSLRNRFSLLLAVVLLSALIPVLVVQTQATGNTSPFSVVDKEPSVAAILPNDLNSPLALFWSAASDTPDYQASLTGRLDKGIQVAGADSYVVSFLVQTANSKAIANVQSLKLSIDISLFEFVRWDGSDINLTILTTTLLRLPENTFSVLSGWSGSVWAAKSPDGSRLLLLIEPYRAIDPFDNPNGYSFDVLTALESIRLAFLPGKSIRDLTNDSVRLMTAVEMEIVNQREQILLNDGTRTVYRYGTQLNSTFTPENDIFEVPPIIDMGLEPHADCEWDEGVVTNAPTCEEAGVMTFTCLFCSESYTVTIASLGHNWDSGTVTLAPTCTAKGVRTFRCSRCSDTRTEDIPEIACEYDAVVTFPTCTEPGFTTYTCKGCGDTYTDDPVPALGHDWDAGTVTLAPTCTAKGTRTFSCSRCTETRTEEIPEIACEYDTVVTLPTCTEPGFTTYTCKYCSDKYTDDPVPALGHDWDAGTVTLAPTPDNEGVRTFKCQRCSETKTEPIPKISLFVVTFVVDEEPYEVISIEEGKTVSVPKDPVKAGYIFLGWNLDDEWFDFSTPITEDIVLTAVWKNTNITTPITSIRIATAPGIPAPAMVTMSRNSRLRLYYITNDGADCEGVVWSVGNQAFATVDNSGNVTTRSLSGTVVLTITDTATGLSHSLVLRII